MSRAAISPASGDDTEPGTRPKPLRLIIGTAFLCIFGLLLLRHRHDLDWRAMGRTLRSLAIGPLLAGLGVIYIGYLLRAWRWALLLGPLPPPPASSPLEPGVPPASSHGVGPFETLAPQLIGFTATALFGRVADLVRPWLIARRLETPLATQLAVYSLERMLDLAAAAAVIASPLLIPAVTAVHHNALMRTAELGLAGVLLLSAGVLILKLSGERLPRLLERYLRRLRPHLATHIAQGMRDFQRALAQLSLARFCSSAALSLLMWAGIAFCYVFSAHACHSAPLLAGLSFAATMPIMAASMGGSLLQMPVIGWFTQVAVLAAALHAVDGIALGPASACGVVMICVTSLSVIPGGLIAARLSGVRLRSVAREARGGA